ncbi:hypothetical protein RhiirA5_505039 [Rhizophagus irregularis]|uniref:Crinkler effector protein N-terminal domain-containing protein n=1 Tax=Rhizophagus irregularis TaxID=588596 RepID=A0A2N0P1J4_9GLOM|nr:hypothetical protein RhiirA5_505039 [Rhizophagus irregularis]
MSVTLFCLVKGNTTANAFSVKISRDEPVSDLKEAIKSKNPQTFASVDAKDIQLWKVEIGDDRDDLLSNLTLQDQPELLATKKISKYFPDSPAEECIHVIVEAPVSTVTSSREQELLDELSALRALLNKSVHAFDVVVSPKRTKSFKWTVNTEDATLEGLKKSIREMEKPPALENDGAVLNIINDSGKFSPRNDQDLRKILQLFVSNVNLKFTVLIETPSKPFNEWTFPKVCELYGLSDDPNPSIDVYPVFSCGSANTKNEKYKEALRKLFDELETRVATTPIDVSYEATKSIYSYTYLVSAAYPFKDQVKVVPEKLIEGKNGRGNLDYGIESRTTGRIVGLVEVKKDDFKQGFAQATVQLESSLGRKRKANEMDDEHGFDKVWGIVTDAEKWYFMECTQDAEGKPSFKLSKPLFVAYEDAGMRDMAEKILGHIIWLLEESQKADSAVNLDKEREIKKPRSSGNLKEKSDTVVKS